MSKYIQWKRSNVDPISVHNYERWFLRYEQFMNGKEHTLENIGKFKEWLQELGYAPKNIQYGLSIVKDYLGYLVATENLPFPIKLFRVKKERSNSHYPITEEEYKKIDALLPDNEPISLQRKLMLSMLWDTGMRIGELLRMRLADVKKRHVIIENEKNKTSRLIAWSERSEKLLHKYLPLRREVLTKEPWLFVSLRMKLQTKLTTRTVQRILCDLRLGAQITNVISPHSFRHGFVHRKLDEGKPITTVAQMLGHSTSINVHNYAKLTGREIRKAWGIK